ncbi:MAG TPA: uroporphyrinogen-III synthase [Geminicoccaceae bacterium]|nr:uroporphyrinogen-III synthase [Geminicoccaceae bacterium]
MHVLITRPRADAAVLAQKLEARGHEVMVEPLLTIVPLTDAVPAVNGVQAILLTSANAVAALRGTDPRLPVFVVGEATARAAREQGCQQVQVAAGDAASLADLIVARCRPSDGALLHLCGAQVRPGLAEPLEAAGFPLRRQVVYRAVAASALSTSAIAAIRSRAIDAVLLFSPRTASILVALIARHELCGCLGRTEAICLSAAVAQPCRSLQWKAIRIAARPEVGSLLGRLEGGGRRC